ncbi:uncharacterized protein LOC125370251 [Ricinus communis]|uniref:uncharacterized protein LOC125370251 n=1 Tax=Ricinus communis TaxID=3988 RepID=UPI00201A3B9D|nr:uncharacterized protein LOC125370251 [Ricinus communis]
MLPTPWTTNLIVDAAAGSSLSSKTPKQAQSLIEEMATNNYQWHITRSRTGCQGSVDYMGSQPRQQNNLYSNTYNPVDSSKKAQVEQQFGKLLNVFKQLHINLPFVEAISQMSRYAKFLEEILSNKRKFEDLSFVTLKKECSAIFQNKLPEKKQDPRSFTIPCGIGDLTISDALADLGASINVIPYNLFAKLGLGETKHTRMSIQLADRSVKYPKGVVENVLVKVDKFIFSVDFVILDMDGGSSVPLILGRPFLATSRAIIDICDGKLELRLQKMLVEDPLQVTLPMEDKHELSNENVLEQLAFLLANEPSKNTDKFIVIDRVGVQKLRSSIEEPPVLELKELPKHIDYAYQDKDNNLPDISAADLTPEVREMTLSSLRKYQKAFAWEMTFLLF